MINQIEVASRSRENVTHTLFLDETGKAVGCTCEFRQYNSFKACSHMNEWNVQVESITGVDLVPHVEDDLRNSCCICGYPTKAVICWKCLQ